MAPRFDLRPAEGDLRLKLATLLRLRWLAVLGQAAAVLFVALVLKFEVPLWRTGGVIAASALVNLWLIATYTPTHRFSARASAAILSYDLVQLAALLYLTGGLTNPFASLFLAPVMVSAAALPQRHTIGLGALAAALVSLLAVLHLPLPWMDGARLDLPAVYIAAIWAALVVTIGFAGVYTFRVAEEARQLADALAATELVLQREQHLSTVDGLAAAAAHKLGTPLATITVVAKEMDLQLPAGHPMKDDTALLRQEAGRCREILAGIASLGSDEGGPLGLLTLRQMIGELSEPHRDFGVALSATFEGPEPEPAMARNPGLMYGLGNIIENAFDFAETRVTVTGEWTSDAVTLTIADDGPGFAHDVLRHLGEPYVTSRRDRLDHPAEMRGAGGGLGLGLFIAKTLIERAGARIQWANATDGPGARVRIVWQKHRFVAPFQQSRG